MLGRSGLRSTVSLTIVCAVLIGLAGCDWSLPRFDPARTADNPDSGLSTANVSRLRLAWRTRGLGGAVTPVLVANGVVTSVGSVTAAFNASDGGLRWLEPDSSFVPGAIERDIVYGTVRRSVAGETVVSLAALALDTGASRWSAPTGGSVVTNVVNGRIYVTGCVCAHGEGPVLEAWNAATHKMVWQTGYGNASAAVGPAVANGVVYAVGTNTVALPYGLTLYAYDEGTGKQLWSRLLRQDCGLSDPVVSGSYVFTTGGTYDAKNGALVNSWPVCSFSAPAVVGTTVFAVVHDATNVTLVSFNGASGASYWAKQVGSTPTTDPLRAPAVGNDAVFVSNTQGVVAYDTATGKPIWFAGGVDGPLHDPVVANGAVYAGTNSSLYAWRVPG